MGAGADEAANHHRQLPALRPVDLAARRFRPIRPLRGARHLSCGALFPRALFFYLADKAKPLARKRADQNLPLAVVADGVANRVDLAAEGGFRNDTAAPYGRHEVILADNALAILNEIEQQIEGLRLGGDESSPAPQFPAVRIEQILFKSVDHSNPARPAVSKNKTSEFPR